jgi:predicted O-methyltransferase YrrM
MNKRSTYYLVSGLSKVDGWLNPTTAHIMTTLADQQTLDGIAGDLAEIGVHYGKSFLAFANSVAPGERIFAIDVFEDQHKNVDQSGSGSRQIFLDNMNIYAPGTPLEVVQESSLDLPAIGWPRQHADSIRFFSIDGSHTREATLNDLRIAEQTTKAGAIVVVDDILSSQWQGVISGVFDYLSSGGKLVPFAVIPNKMLLAKDRRFKSKWTEFIRARYGRLISKRDVKFLDEAIDVVEDDAALMKELEVSDRAASSKRERAMAARVWRERVTYTAISLFVAWHTLAMVVAPAPSTSDLIKGLRIVLDPYLHFFKLDNQWNFFAPDVGEEGRDPLGVILRYVIKDDAGTLHRFDPDAGLNWFRPSSIWFHDWYRALLENPDDFGEEFAALFCREHAELHPVTITLFAAEQKDYGPLDRLRGKQPLDPEFVKVATVRSFECPP